MDTLALLCNLHADGPETLQCLRRAGWDTLAEVESVEVFELATALSISEERATRLKREARHLRVRLEGPEDASDATAGRSSVSLRGERLAPRRVGPQRAELDEAEEPEIELPARDILIPQPGASQAPPSKPLPSKSPRPKSPQAAAAHAPRVAPHAAAPELAPDAIDGLDAAACAALEAAGIASLAALANALPLELAAETGIDYTRLLRLQFLARRRAAPAESKRASRTPADDGESEDVAGPFA